MLIYCACEVYQHQLIGITSAVDMATDREYSTLGAKAFREHYDKLVKSIQEPDLSVLGAKFFSRQIISLETMEMVGNVAISRTIRGSKLMLAVMAHLDVHPGKFEAALDVFREELVYTELADLIEQSYGEQIYVHSQSTEFLYYNIESR